MTASNTVRPFLGSVAQTLALRQWCHIGLALYRANILLLSSQRIGLWTSRHDFNRIHHLVVGDHRVYVIDGVFVSLFPSSIDSCTFHSVTKTLARCLSGKSKAVVKSSGLGETLTLRSITHTMSRLSLCDLFHSPIKKKKNGGRESAGAAGASPSMLRNPLRRRRI